MTSVRPKYLVGQVGGGVVLGPEWPAFERRINQQIWDAWELGKNDPDFVRYWESAGLGIPTKPE